MNSISAIYIPRSCFKNSDKREEERSENSFWTITRNGGKNIERSIMYRDSRVFYKSGFFLDYRVSVLIIRVGEYFSGSSSIWAQNESGIGDTRS